jgi:hypothetical protein
MDISYCVPQLALPYWQGHEADVAHTSLVLIICRAMRTYAVRDHPLVYQ